MIGVSGGGFAYDINSNRCAIWLRSQAHVRPVAPYYQDPTTILPRSSGLCSLVSVLSVESMRSPEPDKELGATQSKFRLIN